MSLSVFVMLKLLFLFTPVKQDIPKSIYDFKVIAVNGSTIDFSDFKGKKILIVNTPLNGYYNHEYTDLEALYQKHKDNLVIVAFIAQDFAVPPGSRQDTSVAGKHYPVTFPVANKTEVRGDDKAPIYQWLCNENYNHFKSTDIKWDFQKYLINENGELVAEFDPKIKPGNPAIIDAIEKK